MNITFKHARQITLLVASSIFVVFCSSFASAQSEAEKLIEQSRCYACHQINAALLAPPYQAIAARHAPRKDVMVDVLARKIVRGGGGSWGVIPMVPNQWVSIREARIMAEWILGLAEER